MKISPPSSNRAPLWTFLSLAAGLSLFMVQAGNVFPDEGWYLYAGKLVQSGLIPYRDFAHFQAPLTPFLFAPLGGDLIGTRLLCAALGLLAIGLTVSESRAKGPTALLVTGALTCLSGYTFRWFTIARNIAPCSALLALGILCFDPRRGGRLALSIACLALAAGFRLSAAGALGALILLLALRGERLWTALALACLACGLIFLPFYMLAPEQAVFCTLKYHTALHSPAAGSLGHLASKLQNIVRFNDKHLLITLVLGAGVLHLGWSRTRELLREDCRLLLALLSSVAVTTLHLIPGRFHPEYHEILVLPLAFLAGAVTESSHRLGATGWAADDRGRRLFLALAFLQVLGVRSHIWYFNGWKPADLEQMAESIRRETPVGGPLFTFVPDLALRSGRPLLPGLEMASVSVAAPSFSQAECESHHMLGLPMMADFFRRGVPALIVWARFEDADSRRIELYPIRERQAVESALQERYEPCGRAGIWTLYRPRTGAGTWYNHRDPTQP